MDTLWKVTQTLLYKDQVLVEMLELVFFSWSVTTLSGGINETVECFIYNLAT